MRSKRPITSRGRSAEGAVWPDPSASAAWPAHIAIRVISTERLRRPQVFRNRGRVKPGKVFIGTCLRVLNLPFVDPANELQ